jgi:hypothetical protein
MPKDTLHLSCLTEESQSDFFRLQQKVVSEPGVTPLIAKGINRVRKRLKAVKDSLPHGEWLPWLETNKKTLGLLSERHRS